MQRKNIAHSVFPTHNGVLSHVAAFMVTVSFVVYSSAEKNKVASILGKHLETAVCFLHIFTFGSWVGVQFWVHVSGFTMYKTLTRNAFAQVQAKIFPMYFMTGIILGSISLLSHIYMNPLMSWPSLDAQSIYQALGLIVSLLCSLVNFIHFGPETIRMVQIRAQRVKFLGIEDGVGPVSPKHVNHDETYREIKRKFIRNHTACSLINVICFGACGVSMWCLASKQILV